MNVVCKAAGNHKYVAGIFYYFGLSLLSLFLIIAVYWQLEKDAFNFEFTEFNITSTQAQRSFYIPINFCSTKVTKFTISRYYKDTTKNIFYNVPDGEYHSNSNECVKTMLVGHTGRLDPGEYEYVIYAKYDINPLRSIQRQVALIHVTVE